MASGQWEGGKGSKPRPMEDRKKFEDNWDKIFGKKPDQVLSNQHGSHATEKKEDVPKSD